MITPEIQAVFKKAESEKLEARATLLRLLNPIAIGEHTSALVGDVRKAFEKWDESQSLMDSIQRFINEEAQAAIKAKEVTDADGEGNNQEEA